MAAGWSLPTAPAVPAALPCCNPAAAPCTIDSPPHLLLQAYQDAAPSSPWPRQQATQQPQVATPSSGGGNGASVAGAAAAGAAPQQHARRRVTAYRGLSASQFQHPLDQQNTALLRALPGLEMLARCVPATAAVIKGRFGGCLHVCPFCTLRAGLQAVFLPRALNIWKRGLLTCCRAGVLHVAAGT